ncbi:MAG: DUF4412 domain-containing protein [Deltaproteobacteria bacterium]|nr:DUF4412 domain-containing protein [Deltaproteobacteria bacterium]
MPRAKFLAFILLIFLAGWARPALAVEFRALVRVETLGMTETGRLYVKGHRQRFEKEEHGTVVINLVDLDKGQALVLFPDTKTYRQYPIEAQEMAGLPVPVDLPPQAEKQGEVDMDGYNCQKYHYIHAYYGEITSWWSPWLGFPLKVIRKTLTGETKVTLSYIKEGWLQDDLFVVPQGYRKISQ